MSSSLLGGSYVNQLRVPDSGRSFGSWRKIGVVNYVLHRNFDLFHNAGDICDLCQRKDWNVVEDVFETVTNGEWERFVSPKDFKWHAAKFGMSGVPKICRHDTQWDANELLFELFGPSDAFHVDFISSVQIEPAFKDQVLILKLS